MSLIKMGGKSPDGKAKAVSVDANGNVGISRSWRSQTFVILNNAQPRTDAAFTILGSSALDVRDFGFVSLRFDNSLGVPVNAMFYSDDENRNLDNWMMRNDRSYFSFVIPANGYSMLTPEDMPELNYFRFIKMRLQPQSAPTTGSLTIEVVAKR
jgi:hypothetical protein